ncbi:hypothetical protein BCR37DRAFT_344266 [Protomyces lactucae-debilis]|uniref:DUF1909-domain-containing protein n=1 Tax=Protomyces lactucae-debilis TaxID=2754530 RepID=A0A1Y2FNE7_PROLT|nr:uncharacterized protein BCR37DRAFT_344266 [Protomyces lactucae-debilis]ORY85530.1 hypothetical protein BCR37DRAFT_344266 [Protomyces lactucae-debilis]
MGNGAKAATKRERNAKNETKGPTSQLKANASAMSIKCKTCLQTFMVTAKRPDLELHATNKHNKTYEECFA